MTSKYAQDIEQLKTDVEVIKAIATERRAVTKDWRDGVDHKLDTIIANGKNYVSTETLTRTMEAHVATCPGRTNSGIISSTLRGNGKLLGAAIGIIVTLSGILAVVIDMLKPYLPNISGG